MYKEYILLIILTASVLSIGIYASMVKPEKDPATICRQKNGTPLYEKYCTKCCYYRYYGCALEPLPPEINNN